LITLAKKINIGERVVYWEFGWEVFNKYPILGVGLGNVGRFSEELLSPEAWKMGEVRKILLYGTTLPNTKNLWVRILSETGIVGFSFYMTWLIILWLSARKLCQNQDATIRTIGLTGQFALIAQIFEGFSLDTFALPFLWVTLGILISTISISRQPIILHE
jgi:O-antigen ligase